MISITMKAYWNYRKKRAFDMKASLDLSNGLVTIIEDLIEDELNEEDALCYVMDSWERYEAVLPSGDVVELIEDENDAGTYRISPLEWIFKTEDGYTLTFDIENNVWTDGDLIFNCSNSIPIDDISKEPLVGQFIKK